MSRTTKRLAAAILIPAGSIDAFVLRRRLTGAILALALQALFLALLLQSLSRPPAAAPEKLAHELTLILPRLREAPPTTPSAPAPASKPAPLLQAPIPLVPFLPNPAAPPAAPLDTRRLGQSIFGCAPENWSSLTPEQRALCPRPGEGVVVLNAPDLLGAPDHVKDEADWQEEWARERSPILLPCGGFVNVMCLLGKIADGSLSDYGDPSKWPHYAVKQLSKNELYKIEQAYKAWNTTYGKKPAAAAPAPGGEQ